MSSVFVSYSRDDVGWMDSFQDHFDRAGLSGIVWQDDKVQPGESWRAKIEEAIENSVVAILQVSRNLLESEFVMNEELPLLLNRRDRGLHILPVLIGRCHYEGTRIGDLQILNRQALSEKDKPGRDDFLRKLTTKVLNCIQKETAAQVVQRPLQDHASDLREMMERLLEEENPLFRTAMATHLEDWRAQASQWLQKGEMHLPAGSTTDAVLMALYGNASKNIFSTCVLDYLPHWCGVRGNERLAAHAQSSARVTRVFVFVLVSDGLEFGALH